MACGVHCLLDGSGGAGIRLVNERLGLGFGYEVDLWQVWVMYDGWMYHNNNNVSIRF